jgi:hypothetical protein
MNVTVKTRNGHRDTAVSSRFSFLLTEALFTSSSPFSPATPFFPASGLALVSFNGPHLKSKF